MPHAVFDTDAIASPITVSANGAARELVPGIGPGGSMAGRAMKRALLIRSAEVMVRNADWAATAEDNRIQLYLKLSQELDLNPGILLPLGWMAVNLEEVTAAATLAASATWHPMTQLNGTVWAPRVVGLRVIVGGTWAGFRARVHLDYDVVEVPWMDWFIMWDFLDNVVDNALEY